MRLIHSKDIDTQNGSTYITLSHCWGPSTSLKPLQTTKANVEAHLQSIDDQQLSKTFQDAIRIARSLGSQYLWIDSLCIIQDDAHDWQVEASKMADVYRGSRLTTVAVDSPDSHGGCFVDIAANTASFEAIYYFNEITTGNVLALKRDILSRKRRSEPYFEQSPATERGWILQETALSPRLIFCARDQFYWQCRTCFHSEDGALEEVNNAETIQNVPTYPTSGDPEDILRAWWSYAVDYSHRKFTKYEDRLAALAGVTRLFEQLAGDVTMLGLWKRTLARDLSWQRSFDRSIGWDHPQYEGKEIENIRSAKIVRVSQVPSWSWLSIIAPIVAARPPWTGSEKADDLEILEWHIEWTGPQYTSPIASTHLSVRSANISAKLVRNQKSKIQSAWRLQSPMFHIRKHLLGSKRYLSVDFEPDSQDMEPDMQVTCLFLYTAAGNPIANRMEVFLVIAPSRKDLGTYHRLGVGHVDTKASQSPIFQGIERSAIRLI